MKKNNYTTTCDIIFMCVCSYCIDKKIAHSRFSVDKMINENHIVHGSF